MIDADAVKAQVFRLVARMLGDPPARVSDDTPLLGAGGGLDSMRLVELCLRLEDLASRTGRDFDWTSPAAMSASRSMFRTAGTLAAEFVAQLERRA